MSKFYFCKTIGDGTEDNPFSPSISLYTSNYIGTDARCDATKGGWIMVECQSITNTEHLNAIADESIVFFDVEDIALDDKINLIADRAKLITSLYDQGLNVEGLSSNNTLREVLISVVNQLAKRQNPQVTNVRTHYDN